MRRKMNINLKASGEKDQVYRHIKVKTRGAKQRKIKLRYALMATVMATTIGMVKGGRNAQAASCPDIKIIFARGSGGTRYDNIDYQAFRDTLQAKLATTTLSYEIDDLDYPAVGVGIEHIGTTIGAFVSGGEEHEFGESMNTGVDNLRTILQDKSCPDTKYVLGGYSQGAIVIKKAVEVLNADRLIYLATFGDPKIYLPEGKGLIPAACRGDNLSNYRMYVPDCQAYKGILGAQIPYEPERLTGKVGTWCNKRDILCSSHISVVDHTSYVADNLYEDASRVIFDKITKAFGVENHISSPHDTAILIDSTVSMGSMLSEYREEALRLAEKTLEAGGRVALYDYRDLKDPYEPHEYCNFETCTLETFRAGLDKIRTGGGGDWPESLLSSSFHVMKDLEWKQGSTKSLVILTDANFLSPDRDGTTFDDVVTLSKKIDPVNFYIVTKPESAEAYADLAAATDGKVVTDPDEWSLLTDYIAERFDSLPRVEEASEDELGARPVLVVSDVNWLDEQTARIRFSSTGTKTIVAMDDIIMGTTEDSEITITGFERAGKHIVTLTPTLSELKGTAVDVELYWRAESLQEETPDEPDTPVVIPKAPNTGRQ